jgi:hypothetical protein
LILFILIGEAVAAEGPGIERLFGSCIAEEMVERVFSMAGIGFMF